MPKGRSVCEDRDRGSALLDYEIWPPFILRFPLRDERRCCFASSYEGGREKLDFRHIPQLIARMLMEVIQTHIPHQWIYTVEPFINPYNGKISYDYSGEVRKMKKEEFAELVRSLGRSKGSRFYCSPLDELLNNVYIDRWVPTYMSNYGKRWVTYCDLLRETFDQWKYSHFEIYDEDGNEVNEDLNLQLDEIFEDFLENTSHEPFVREIEKTIA
ncbi:hypothetical protein P9743_06010 [Anoxybacillus geothermalis]|nr:hypothetical protein [Anoxybacillus geothermalis]